jgi:Uma2 family endonuclease
MFPFGLLCLQLILSRALLILMTEDNMQTARSLVTYDDYIRLPDDGCRYEVLQGELVMTPAPNMDHQRISRNLEFILHSYASEKGLGEVFYAPVDVVLSMTNILQPDIVFVSSGRKHIIAKKNIVDAPDLVVEIILESTEERSISEEGNL